MALAGSVFFASPVGAGTRHAGIVIVHGDGSTRTRCVALRAGAVRTTGFQLLQRSKIPFKAADFGGSLGRAACFIDGEGVDTQSTKSCFSDPDFKFWGYVIQNPDQTTQHSSNRGPDGHNVRPGEVDYWVWGSAFPPTVSSPTTFSAICP